jgi:PAS domain S-box-containing protein
VEVEKHSSEAERDALMATVRHTAVALCQILRFRDGHLRVAFASDAACNLLQIRPGDFGADGIQVSTGMEPAGLAGLCAYLNVSARDARACTHEFRSLGADGVDRWLLAHLMPEQWAADTLCWHCTLTDVSALQQRENALRSHEERLSRAADSARVGIWEYDVRSRELTWSDVMFELYGARREDFSGAYDAWATRLHPQDRAATEAALQAAIDGKADYNASFRVLWPDGQVHHIQGHAAVLRDERGNPTRMLGTNWDNNAYAVAHDRLNYLSAAISKSRTSFFWVDLDARIVDVNEYACASLGYGLQDLLGKELSFVNPHFSWEHWRERVSPVNRGLPRTFTARHRHRDGSFCPVEVTSQYIEVGSDGYIFSFVRDESEREAAAARQAALEAQLRESQKMEAIGTLAGGIAHDFNNALATILGNLELARQDAARHPSIQESLAEIQKAGLRARDLVQQILAFSRRQPTELQHVDLAAVLREATRLLRATTPAGISIQVNGTAEALHVMANASQLEQVIINLGTNAMQALASQSGRIEFSLDAVAHDRELTARHPLLVASSEPITRRIARLTVADTGPGMTAAVRERIFEPFYTTKPPGEGTGLGLSVVHGIVRSHNGVIAVESEPGKGTRFTVLIPLLGDLTPAAADAASRPQPLGGVPVKGPGRGRHILYVDDDESLLFMVKRLLERCGFRISVYSDSTAAMAALRADPAAFDLVLTDYNMPDRSGLDVAREVRLLRADLPVAVASGFVDETLHAKARAAGVREVIFKATDVASFCETIQRLADEQSMP